MEIEIQEVEVGKVKEKRIEILTTVSWESFIRKEVSQELLYRLLKSSSI